MKSGKQLLVSLSEVYPGQLLLARLYQLLFHLAWFFSLSAWLHTLAVSPPNLIISFTNVLFSCTHHPLLAKPEAWKVCLIPPSPGAPSSIYGQVL